MKPIFASLQQRFANRPDSEHQQALVRLAILALVLVYLYGLWTLGNSHADALRDVLVLVAVECVLGFALIVGIAMQPGVSGLRRIAGMCADYSMLGMAMYFMGEPLAPLYIVYVWTTIGSGLRYGGKYLIFAGTLACLSFGLVICFTPYWIENRTLALGLLVGLIAIPAYLSSLMNAVQRATVEARRANEAKSRFLATMSHEFRTPLNGIVGVSDLLSTTELNREQKEYSEVIIASAKTLLTLVENVLDISAIEAGKLRRQLADFAVVDIVTDVQKILSGAAAEKGLRFNVSVAENVPEQVFGDSDHLRQILINLTANAIKFTEVGHVSVSVACVPQDVSASAPVNLRFSVVDTGIGIAPEAQARVFKAFEQADQGHGRRYGGSGLGTSIAKALTDLAGGKIGFDSKPGDGSHFWVEIPFARASTPSHAVKRRYRADRNIIAFDDPFVRHRLRVRALRVLIADDQAANRMVLQRLLQKAGHEVISASGGEEVLDLLADDTFDAVIIDLHMPDVSGLDVLKQARFMQSGHAPTPLIVLSADATPETIQACRQAGAHAFLSKPIANSILLDTLAGVADASTFADQSAAMPLTPPVRATPAEIAIISEPLLEDLDDQFGAEFLKLFVKECMRDAYRLISKLEETGSVEAWEEFRDCCHALKGVASNIGAEQLVDSAAATMKLGTFDLPTQWRRRVIRLREQFQSARQALVQRLALPDERDGNVDSLS